MSAMGQLGYDEAMKKEPPYHYMYVLSCADDTLYAGYTTDVEQRVATHNAGKGAKYTARRLPVELIAFATFTTKHAAMSAEYHFKRLPRSEKLSLLGQAHAGAPFEAILIERFQIEAGDAPA